MMYTKSLFLSLQCLFTLMLVTPAQAVHTSAENTNTASIEITADKSLEFYQDQNTYVARGNARAVRGALTIAADTLTAHQRPHDKHAQKEAEKNSQTNDIDQMTADGNVVITKPNTRVTGDHAVDNTDQHVSVVTGANLRYESDRQTVTALDSLEYWDEQKLAVARGKAVAVRGDRHVEGDVLTAEFRAGSNGQDQLYKLTALGNVTVVTKNDVTRGQKAVYDAARDIAIVSGHVLITRGDGTQLTGDMAESDFAANQSRIVNDGSGRVRALLPAHNAVSGSGKKAVITP